MQIATAHRNTDFDALASIIGATILYPGTVPVLPKSTNPNVRAFVSIHKNILKLESPEDIPFDEVDTLIVVDTNSWSRLEGMAKLKEREDLKIIMWDHHDNVGDLNAGWKLQEDVGSTITLMVDEMKRRGYRPSSIEATLFLLGLYEDTGNLTFPSTTAMDAHSAAYLLESHADLRIVKTFLQPAYGEKQKGILFDMLKSPSRTKLNGYEISFNKHDLNGHVGNLSLVVHMYREIVNVDAAFGIFRTKDKKKCIVIGRSHLDSLDMGDIMRAMGGGGLPGAGSAMVKGGDPEEVEERIKMLIMGDHKSSVQISDLMSFPPMTLKSTTTMEEAAMMLRDKGCTGFPVLDGEELVGIISRSDFRKVRKDSGLKAPVTAFMTRNVKHIEPGVSPTQAARLMVRHDIGRLPVMEDGKVIGIITRSDAMTYFYDLMPGK